MSLSEDLLRHANQAVGGCPLSTTTVTPAMGVDLRRAVSAAYYALFHYLSEAAVRQVAPQMTEPIANRVHRWIDHSELKKICREFAAVPLRPPLSELLGASASDDMQTVAVNLAKLQEAKHSADYDLGYQLDCVQAVDLVKLAVTAMAAWNRMAPSAESNIFILSLLLWKKWDLSHP